MSKLDELIAELCPDGVEYRRLKDVCTFKRGTPITKKDIVEGDIPVIAGGQEPAYYHNQANRTGETVVISSSGAAGFVSYWEQPIFVSDAFSVEPNGKILTKYLYYFLKSKQDKIYSLQKAGGVPHVYSTDIAPLKIPLPPLIVQQEIVRILDALSKATTELNKELNIELEARRKQYEYYRDELFGGNYEEMLRKAKHNNVKLVSLHELGKFIRGKRFVRKDMKQEKGVPCIHYGDLYTYYGLSAERTKWYLDEELGSKMRFAEKNDVIIVQSGENKEEIGIGVAWLGDEKVAVHDACYIFKHNINPKYISHFLRTNIYNYQIRRYVVEGKICSISAKNIGRALIPVPSLEEQQRIVDILDGFDTLINNINTSISAEIELRQKQYEYYLNKLLDFKEVSS